MALAEPIKKGGPYTKKEQEERKFQVYQLHFEENLSAVKIAELLNVSRNTINGDIRYWHSQLANEMKAQDLKAKMTKQFQRMEMQRESLFDELENAENLKERMDVLKFIFDVDQKLYQFLSKLILCGITSIKPTVKLEESKEDVENKDEIKEFVKDLILEDVMPDSENIFSENELKFRLIKTTKCDTDYADRIIEEMKQKGVLLCKDPRNIQNSFPRLISEDFSTKYNLRRFAVLRGYLTSKEWDSFYEKQAQIRLETEKAEEEREEKYIAKFGPDKSKWSEDVKYMYDHYLDPE